MKIEILSRLSELFEADLVDLDSKIVTFDSWDSLTSLSIIAFASEEYGVEISNSDILNSVTISGLVDLIHSKAIIK